MKASEIKPKKPRKLSLKQEKFINEYLETGNGTKSALKAYDTDNYFTANSIAVENLQKPAIYQTIQKRIQSASKRAFERMTELVETEEDPKVSYLASKDILDRAGHAPVQKSAQLSHKTIKIDL